MASVNWWWQTAVTQCKSNPSSFSSLSLSLYLNFCDFWLAATLDGQLLAENARRLASLQTMIMRLPTLFITASFLWLISLSLWACCVTLSKLCRRAHFCVSICTIEFWWSDTISFLNIVPFSLAIADVFHLCSFIAVANKESRWIISEGMLFSKYLEIFNTFKTAQIDVYNCTFSCYNCTIRHQLHTKICPDHIVKWSFKAVIYHAVKRSISWAKRFALLY